MRSSVIVLFLFLAPEDDDEIWKRYKSATLWPIRFFSDDFLDADADFFDADFFDADFKREVGFLARGAFLNLKRESLEEEPASDPS